MSFSAHGAGENGGGDDLGDSVSEVGSMQLADKRLIEAVKELKGEETVGTCSVFPRRTTRTSARRSAPSAREPISAASTTR